ncbi:hypothetical protein GLOIN_2v1772394 [Rhizophagus irregularis DAOM 181602=DAOM 197198]|uniref:Uncharacterized protein n=1 Tax=Rhizophagus irregularis (strain DAOM 181602 / DAOM 197198 / MUCL 43194) TaxID=747089 RepID=U9TVK7_RHIID|nr:hypothetical protein GLOIN_2v1772394 [Rhizophagus irregularis DAOM 181602=DAOM 197198]
MKTSNNETQYLIGTCFGCKKCLYCGICEIEFSMRKKHVLVTKISKPNKKNQMTKKNFSNRIDSSKDDWKNSNVDVFDKTNNKEQIISFNLVIKPATVQHYNLNGLK